MREGLLLLCPLAAGIEEDGGDVLSEREGTNAADLVIGKRTNDD